MLEIKSGWSTKVDKQGNHIPVLTLFMVRNNQPYNCALAISKEMIEDGDVLIEKLNTMIIELVNRCYPERCDPVWKAKKRLKEINKEKEWLNKMIKELEEKD